MGRGGRLPAPPLLRLPSPLRGIAASISAVLRHQEYEGYVLTQNTSTSGKASPKPAAKRTARAGAKSATMPTAAKRGSAPEVDANANANANAAESAATVRVIKKYPNRRLYDTTSSTYITLSDVRALVMQGDPFVVRDAKGTEDLTRSILLQIILEEESGGVPMLSEQVLANLIRFYGHAMQGLVGGHLEKNMQMFTDMQAQMKAQSTILSPDAWQSVLGAGGTPVMADLMSTYTEQTQSAMKAMQEQLQKQGEQMWSAMGIKR
jgi:polyhydroxyalkanoate synthesis repressor PhaR